MVTAGSAGRRGLPRTVGGEPWPPPADEVVGGVTPAAETPVWDEPDGDTVPRDEVVREAPAAVQAADAETDADVSSSADVADAAVTAANAGVRRGLPRTAGGEPWPPAAVGGTASMTPRAVAMPGAAEQESVAPTAETVPDSAAPASTSSTAAATSAPTATSVPPASAAAPAGGSHSAAPAARATAGAPAGAVRRGLPRTTGADGWPPAGTKPSIPASAPEAVAANVASSASSDADSAPTAHGRSGEATVAAVAVPVAVPSATVAERDVSTPLPFTRTVWAGAHANVHPQPVEPRRIGRFTVPQLLGLTVVGGGALIVGAFLVVCLVRAVMPSDAMQAFLTSYPGVYESPIPVDPGFPAWAQWQHFFNIFLMVLIIRTGWGVRTEQRPEAFWSAKWAKDSKRKISLTLWFHQSLDILWLINGLVFVALLFASGHWVRIVPTSWDVFPNALSAIIQYISLDWPPEHGWVNYNSIQQLMYFLTVFVAAPLAAITGVRMSGVWPANAKTLNRIYPVEVARAIHFPVMLYFVIFIVIHVTLVFATGALRNLNHMFGGTDEINWNGFWIMTAGLIVVVGAVFASRTLVLAPIAKLFGKVSQR